MARVKGLSATLGFRSEGTSLAATCLAAKAWHQGYPFAALAWAASWASALTSASSPWEELLELNKVHTSVAILASSSEEVVPFGAFRSMVKVASFLP